MPARRRAASLGAVRRPANRETGRVLALVGRSVRAWQLWEIRAVRDLLRANMPTPELLVFKASQLGPERDSGYASTWRNCHY